MTREEREKAIRILDDMKVKIDIPKAAVMQNDKNWALDMAIKALEQEPKTKIKESNFSQEQYKADLQCAYDCGKSVLDKLRAEIAEYGSICVEYKTTGRREDIEQLLTDVLKQAKKQVLDVIDKYRAESEDKE